MESYGHARVQWFKSFLKLPNGIPSHDTINRVFAALDPHAFLECFTQWVQGLCPNLSDGVVAIDGKALRRAINEGDSIPYIVSAWATQSGLVLGQVKVDEKSNEITAVPKLLDALVLKGCIVTLDAMGCQKDIAANIIDKQADYVLALKGNHATVHEEIKKFFADAVPPCADQCADTATQNKMDFFKTVETNRGRGETQRYYQSTDIEWFQDKPLWKKLTSIGMVETLRKVKGKTSYERRYFLSSLPLDAQRFAKAVRGHWGIENSLHWRVAVSKRFWRLSLPTPPHFAPKEPERTSLPNLA
jgi:predicted transposase YbfD/YdcC